jgi:hypothetical protein
MTVSPTGQGPACPLIYKKPEWLCRSGNPDHQGEPSLSAFCSQPLALMTSSSTSLVQPIRSQHLGNWLTKTELQTAYRLSVSFVNLPQTYKTGSIVWTRKAHLVQSMMPQKEKKFIFPPLGSSLQFWQRTGDTGHAKISGFKVQLSQGMSLRY